MAEPARSPGAHGTVSAAESRPAGACSRMAGRHERAATDSPTETAYGDAAQPDNAAPPSDRSGTAIRRQPARFRSSGIDPTGLRTDGLRKAGFRSTQRFGKRLDR